MAGGLVTGILEDVLASDDAVWSTKPASFVGQVNTAFAGPSRKIVSVKGSVRECRNVDWTITSSGRGGRTSKG